MNILFDFILFILQHLAVLLRKPKQVQWLICLIQPFRLMLQDLQIFIDNSLLDAQYNAQTHVFTHLLQSKFPTFRPYIENSNKTQISDTYIGTGVINDYDVFFGTSENNDYNVIIGTGITGTALEKPDFWVLINVSIITDYQIMNLRGYINKYKIYSTTYQIVNFEKTVIYYKNYN